MIRALPEEEIWSVVDEAIHGHLACHAGGQTYIVPISYARDGRSLVGVTSIGKKVEMMRENPDVCVQCEIRREPDEVEERCALGTV